MDGIGFLLKSMGIPVEEIMSYGKQLIELAEQCKAQLDRIERRLDIIIATDEAMDHGTVGRELKLLASNGSGTGGSTSSDGSGHN